MQKIKNKNKIGLETHDLPVVWLLERKRECRERNIPARRECECRRVEEMVEAGGEGKGRGRC
jgi:hypothetical protein